MKLISAAVSGNLTNDLIVPTPARRFLLNAGLMIASATVLCPRDYNNPLGFRVYELNHANGNKLTDKLDLMKTGELSHKFCWLSRMLAGFHILQSAIDLAKNGAGEGLVQALTNILLKLNLLLGIVESIRSENQAKLFSKFISDQLDDCLAIFGDFGVLPPDLVGQAIVHSAKQQKAITDSAEVWEQVTEAAYEFWDIAEAKSEQARNSQSFSSLFANVQVSLPYYEAATQLFLDAISRYVSLHKTTPKEILIDYGVAEEHRVGVFEFLQQFGHHLITRPGLFLGSNRGKKLRNAMRSSLLATRAQINFYPDRLKLCWDSAVSHVGETLVVPEDDEWLLIAHDLEQHVETNFPQVFTDPDVVMAATQLYKNTYGFAHLSLQPDWQKGLFVNSHEVLQEHKIKIPQGTHTYSPIPGDRLIKEIIGNEWREGVVATPIIPFQISISSDITL